MKILGIFSEEENMVKAFHTLREKNIAVEEAYTPYPIHEVLHLMGRESKMTVAAWLYGLIAIVSVLGFLYYTSVIDWPLNYGGKPFNSFPSFIVITIVLTIFIVTILSLFTFSVRAKIYPGKKAEIIDERATDDKFILVLDSGSVSGAGEILRALGAEEIIEK